MTFQKQKNRNDRIETKEKKKKKKEKKFSEKKYFVRKFFYELSVAVKSGR